MDGQISFNNIVKKYIEDKRTSVPLNISPLKFKSLQNPTVRISREIHAAPSSTSTPLSQQWRSQPPAHWTTQTRCQKKRTLSGWNCSAVRLSSPLFLSISASQQQTCCCWNIPSHASCWAPWNGIRSLLQLTQPFAISHFSSSALSPLSKLLNKCICSGLIHVSLPPFLYETSCKQTFWIKRKAYLDTALSMK